MTQFTKGPWVAISRGFFDGREEGDVHQKDNWDVGMQDGEFMRGNFRMEDAHLIAAAPDLYEALMGVMSEISSLGDEVYYFGSTDPFDIARAALAKARGEA